MTAAESPMSSTPDDRTGATLDLGDLPHDASPAAPTSGIEDAPQPERYRLMECIGVGGMGEVWAARDTRLLREVAVKVLHPRLSGPAALARFDAEARIVAQLEHPGIVPIYDYGRLPDGRAFFAMKRIVGRTLAEVGDEAPTLRRVQRLNRVAQTLAFAHQRGVVHRDLKPSNVMVGPFGEVLVLDWGIARLASEGLDEPLPESVRDGVHTRAGSVTGTIATMAPEQAWGKAAGPPADVFALSVMLFEILTGAIPHPERTLESRRRGERVPRPIHGDPILVDLAMEGLSPDPDERPTAGSFASALEGWLDGTARRSRALEVVVQAREELPHAAALHDEASRGRQRARSVLDALQADTAETEKHESWALLERASDLERDAVVARARYVQKLQGALTIDPECTPAHALLAEHWRGRHAAHEALGETLDADAALPFLEAHDRGEHAAYLEGRGLLTLRSSPNAQAMLFEVETCHRRRIPVLRQGLGSTPLVDLSLPIGTYVVRLTAHGHTDLDVPVKIRRLAHETWADPDGHIHTHTLLRGAATGKRVVTAGWFEIGTGVPSGHVLPRQRVWCDAFVMAEYPVTNAEYVAFLDALPLARASRHVPRDLEGQPVFSMTQGRHQLGRDAHGHLWSADMPVVLVTWDDAMAYACWCAEQTGQPWRLPWELEWAKAARGVDYRVYPWGDAVEVTWGRMIGSPGPPGPHSIHAYPADVSPYGVRHLGGQAAAWLLDAFPLGGQLDGERVRRGPVQPSASGYRHIRGGGWRYGMGACRSDSRKAAEVGSRSENVGIRLVRNLA